MEIKNPGASNHLEQLVGKWHGLMWRIICEFSYFKDDSSLLFCSLSRSGCVSQGLHGEPKHATLEKLRKSFEPRLGCQAASDDVPAAAGRNLEHTLCESQQKWASLRVPTILVAQPTNYPSEQHKILQYLDSHWSQDMIMLPARAM